MAAKALQLAVSSIPIRLSDVYLDGTGIVNAAHDVPYRQVILSAQTADIQIGSDPAVLTTSTYGVNLPSAAPAAPVVLGPYETGPIKLSDLYAISTTATLHILGIPY
jgi:hypothetical protein